jgi:hypothetical protein
VATPKSNAANDATVLLTGPHVDRLTDAFRGANISINRLEGGIKELLKSNEKVVSSNEKVAASNEKVAASNKELFEELRKWRQNERRRADK